MGEAFRDAGVEHKRLESVTRIAGNDLGLGFSVGGLILALYGVLNLRYGPTRIPFLFLFVLFGIFVIPRVFSRLYYRPKFGYVKRVSPNPSWTLILLSIAAFAVFLFLFFKVSDYANSGSFAFGFEPLTFFAGIIFLAISILRKQAQGFYNRYDLLMCGLAFVLISFLPLVHLQSKAQVLHGWFWIVAGTDFIVTGVRTHRTLVHNLSPTGSGKDHA